MLLVADNAIEAFTLPDVSASSARPIDLKRRRTFPDAHNVIERLSMILQWPHNCVHVIGHDHVAAELSASLIAFMHLLDEECCQIPLSENATSGALIEVAVEVFEEFAGEVVEVALSLGPFVTNRFQCADPAERKRVGESKSDKVRGPGLPPVRQVPFADFEREIIAPALNPGGAGRFQLEFTVWNQTFRNRPCSVPKFHR